MPGASGLWNLGASQRYFFLAGDGLSFTAFLAVRRRVRAALPQ
jgi:hypothetical protein